MLWLLLLLRDSAKIRGAVAELMVGVVVVVDRTRLVDVGLDGNAGDNGYW